MNFLKTNYTLNKEKVFVVIFITKYFKSEKTIRFFKILCVFLVRRMFLSNEFSMSEMEIYQILRLNYYKKLKEWWTDDVDGDCISSNLYRNTENSIVLLKRWRGDFRKEEYCQIYQQCFYLEEVSQIQWSISKKQNNGRAYETKIGDKEHPFDYCFEFNTNKKSRFVRIFLIGYPNLKDFRLFILQCTKKKMIKMYILVISFFTG